MDQKNDLVWSVAISNENIYQSYANIGPRYDVEASDLPLAFQHSPISRMPDSSPAMHKTFSEFLRLLSDSERRSRVSDAKAEKADATKASGSETPPAEARDDTPSEKEEKAKTDDAESKPTESTASVESSDSSGKDGGSSAKDKVGGTQEDGQSAKDKKEPPEEASDSKKESSDESKKDATSDDAPEEKSGKKGKKKSKAKKVSDGKKDSKPQPQASPPDVAVDNDAVYVPLPTVALVHDTAEHVLHNVGECPNTPLGVAMFMMAHLDRILRERCATFLM